MTITFENVNDVVVYALEKIIASARRTQQIFVAHCVRWLASIIGLEQALITYIDNLRIRSEVSLAEDEEWLAGSTTPIQEGRRLSPFATGCEDKGISTVPRDIQEESRSIDETRHIHPERVSQVQDANINVSDWDLDSSGNERQLRVVQHTEQFIRKSRRERRRFEKQADPLTKTRLGKIPAKPLTKKPRQYLQSIAKPTIADYLMDRK